MGGCKFLIFEIYTPCLAVLAKFFYVMSLCIIGILPNPDRNLGSKSIWIKPVHLYIVNFGR